MGTLVALAGACGVSEEQRPNVILITVDTLRADHLTPYGYERDTSPFLAELAAQGFVFENAIAQCGTTPQSLSSMMTGLYPFTDGVLTSNGRFAFLRRENRTLAASLAEAGYETHAVTSQIQAARVTGLDLGFGSFDGVEIGPDKKQERNRRADEMTDRALTWLREREDPERPFFLWLHYLDPHHPYKPPGDYDVHWTADAPTEEGETRTYRYDPKGALDHPVSDGELQRLVLSYDREIRFTDDQLRRLFAEGFGEHLDDSVVIFSADHGEALGDHGMIGHNDLFEPILVVPLLLRLPGGEPTGRLSDAVMLVDLYPTVLELARVPLRESLRGHSLVPLLLGTGRLPERVRLAEYPGHQALYVDRYKLMRRKRGKGPMLFDIVRDGGEVRDVSARHPDVVQRLLDEAEALARAPLAPLESEGGDASELPAVTPEMLEELEALGYGGH